MLAFESDLTNPFKMEGTEDAPADHMRMKLLYDLAYSAATESLRAFLPMELSISGQDAAGHAAGARHLISPG